MAIPNPFVRGAVTRGPPLSRQLNVNAVDWPCVDVVQKIRTAPLPADSAPYFAAFVASSCSASEKLCACFGESEMSAPSAFARPPHSSRSERTLSRTLIGVHLDLSSWRFAL